MTNLDEIMATQRRGELRRQRIDTGRKLREMGVSPRMSREYAPCFSVASLTPESLAKFISERKKNQRKGRPKRALDKRKRIDWSEVRTERIMAQSAKVERLRGLIASRTTGERGASL